MRRAAAAAARRPAVRQLQHLARGGSARRPCPCSICSWQRKPSATISASSPARRARRAAARARRTPSTRRSASVSSPNAPAMPQQPRVGLCDRRARSLEQLRARLEACRAPSAWQWPCTQRPAGELRRLVVRARAPRNSARRNDCLGAAWRPRRPGSSFGSSSLEDRDAARLDADDRRAGTESSRSVSSTRLAASAAPGRACRSRRAAARSRGGRAGSSTSVAGGLEHLDRGDADLGVEVVVERVGPEDDPRARRGPLAAGA